MENIICHECPVAIQAKGISGLDCIHDISISSSLFYYKKAATSIDKQTADIELENLSFVQFGSLPQSSSSTAAE